MFSHVDRLPGFVVRGCPFELCGWKWDGVGQGLGHRDLHSYGDEASWWAGVSIDPLPIALELWRRSPRNRRRASFLDLGTVISSLWFAFHLPSPSLERSDVECRVKRAIHVAL
jgi:hypothetical protein